MHPVLTTATPSDIEVFYGGEFMPNPAVLIIGAGMSGLAAAHCLRERGVGSVLVDKGRGVGGRVATRRVAGPGVSESRFDHGAQFFTAREPAFREQVAQWEALGLATPWCTGFPAAGGGAGHLRYRAVGGMTAIPKHLAEGLDLRLGERIEKIARDGARWIATSHTGLTLHGDALIVTAPVPQTLELLDASGLVVDATHRQDLEGITYHCCLAVMAVLDGPSGLPEPGAVRFDAEPIDWIADNHRKGISPDGWGVTIHASPAFSREHFDGDREAAADRLLAACADQLGANIVQRQVHGWRYSQPVQCHPERTLVVSDAPPLALAGDAFGGPRVEGAFHSGQAAAEQVAIRLGVAV